MRGAVFLLVVGSAALACSSDHFSAADGDAAATPEAGAGADGGDRDAGGGGLDGGGAKDAGQRAYVLEILADAPVGYWKLDEQGPLPQDALDTSPAHHTGAYSSDGLKLGVPGAVSTAVAFGRAGSPGHVYVDDATHAFDFPAVAAYSIELWFQRDLSSSTAIDGRFVSYFDGGTTPTSGYAVFADGGTLHFTRYHADGGATSDDVTYAWTTDDKFHHLVATFDGSSATLFLDGAQVASVPASASQGTVSPTTHLALGTGPTGLDGTGATLDEVAIYRTALSPARIKAHFTAAPPP